MKAKHDGPTTITNRELKRLMEKKFSEMSSIPVEFNTTMLAYELGLAEGWRQALQKKKGK